MTTLTNNFAQALVYNNRFSNKMVDGTQIGVENIEQWKNFITNLHRTAYSIYEYCENQGLSVEDATIDKTPIFDSIRAILNLIGEVKGHKMYATEGSAIAIIGYAGKRGNVNSDKLNEAIKARTLAKKEYENIPNGTTEEYRASKEKAYDEACELVNTLKKEADMQHKQPTMTAANAFRLDLEHYFARAISGQMAKSLAELDAEAEARKEARKAAAKARKAAKANATK